MMEEQKLSPTYDAEVSILVHEAFALAYKFHSTTKYSVQFELAGHVNGISMHIAKDKTEYNEWIAQGHIYSLSSAEPYASAAASLNKLKYLVQNLQALVDGFDILPRLPLFNCSAPMADLAGKPTEDISYGQDS